VEKKFEQKKKKKGQAVWVWTEIQRKFLNIQGGRHLKGGSKGDVFQGRGVGASGGRARIRRGQSSGTEAEGTGAYHRAINA